MDDPGYSTTSRQWGIEINGHDFDLQDWQNQFRPPFDPWVEKHDETYIFRTRRFDGIDDAEAVSKAASFLVGHMNGAMFAVCRAKPLTTGALIELKADGSRGRSVFLAMAGAAARGRASAVAVVLDKDGKERIQPPVPTQVQEWAEIASADEQLADALMFSARMDWFDIYKAIECLEAKAGGEQALRQLNWISKDELGLLKRTANSFRHWSRKFDPPANPMSLDVAHDKLGSLVSAAFTAEAGRRSASKSGGRAC